MAWKGCCHPQETHQTYCNKAPEGTQAIPKILNPAPCKSDQPTESLESLKADTNDPENPQSLKLILLNVYPKGKRQTIKPNLQLIDWGLGFYFGQAWKRFGGLSDLGTLL